MVRPVRLELTPARADQILSLACLPFHHGRQKNRHETGTKTGFCSTKPLRYNGVMLEPKSSNCLIESTKTAEIGSFLKPPAPSAGLTVGRTNTKPAHPPRRAGRHPIPDRVRHFWAQVNCGSPLECWNWKRQPGGKGYPKVWDGAHTIEAQRYCWMIAFGPIPAGLLVCHKCDNRRCVNPFHLFLGTIADNQADKVAKGRQSRGETQGNRKLSEADVREIRRLAGRFTDRAIGQRFGVRPGCILKVRTLKTWKHVRAEGGAE